MSCIFVVDSIDTDGMEIKYTTTIREMNNMLNNRKDTKLTSNRPFLHLIILATFGGLLNLLFLGVDRLLYYVGGGVSVGVFIILNTVIVLFIAVFFIFSFRHSQKQMDYCLEIDKEGIKFPGGNMYTWKQVEEVWEEAGWIVFKLENPAKNTTTFFPVKIKDMKVGEQEQLKELVYENT